METTLKNEDNRKNEGKVKIKMTSKTKITQNAY